ncbi:hypothetical protein, partial [Staphylococcus aureus]
FPSFRSINKMKETTLQDFKNIAIPQNLPNNLHQQFHK